MKNGHINHQRIENNECKISGTQQQIIIQMVKKHVKNAFLIM